MFNRWITVCGITFLLLCLCSSASAQTDRVQYSRFLSNSYVGLHVGYIKYPFSNALLESPYVAESVKTPHLAVGVLLFGHEFNKYLSGQISYIRPVKWTTYLNINGGGGYHSVWTNIAGLTLKPRLPITRTLSIYGEGGLGIVTRKGIDIGTNPPIPALKDANYSGFLGGGGLQYNVSPNWDLDLGVVAAPAHAGARQPQTTFYSAGFHYTMRPLTDAQVQDRLEGGLFFPRNIVQLGFTTDALGNGINKFVTSGAIPIFWAGTVEVTHGFTVNFQHNLVHTRRIFSLDLGTGASTWKSRKNGEKFSTASVYPVFRFTAVRSKAADLYLNYSLAGPTFISKTIVDNEELGKRFTFQDFLAMGLVMGPNKRINSEIRISHFSNGNVFPRNAGVTVPLTLNLGYVF